MKNILTLLLILSSLIGLAQTDSVVVYDTTIQIYRIDTAIVTDIDTITTGSNIVYQYVHYTETRGGSFNYQPQFFIRDSLNNELLPVQDLLNNGWRSSGTVKEFTIDSAKAAQTPDSLRTFYILPELQSIFGPSNVTKL